MRSKLVLWGTNARDEKILLGIELRAKDSVIELNVFQESQATEAFYNDLLHKWRMGEEITFPEGFQKIERPLSMTSSILPEDIRVDRGDVLQRAQAEWHFVVLADKLYQLYKDELEELKEKVANLDQFDRSLWNELQNLWKKIQEQSRAKALFHKHANELRDEANVLFKKMKAFRKVLDEEFAKASHGVKEELEKTLNEIESRIEKGLGLKPIFDDLKKIQQKFREHKFVRADREALWNRIDKAFKTVKGKRFGDGDGENSKLARLQKRYDGMLGAIQRMEQSINRDKKEIEFQKMKIGTTDGQLEAQIRTAKLKMLEDRINSKDIKFKDMLATKEKLEMGLQKEKERLEKRAKIEHAKKEAKERIQNEIKENKAHLATEEEKLKEAADKIKKAKESRKQKKQKSSQTESMLDAISITVGESINDVVDTLKAITEVVVDRVEEVVDDIKASLEEE